MFRGFQQFYKREALDFREILNQKSEILMFEVFLKFYSPASFTISLNEFFYSRLCLVGLSYYF